MATKRQKDAINREELRIALIRAGINNHAELSRKTGLSRGAISEFFKGRSPHYDTIIKIARAANLTAEGFNAIFFGN